MKAPQRQGGHAATDLIELATRTYARGAARFLAIAALLNAPAVLAGLWLAAAYRPLGAAPPGPGYLAAVAAVGLLTAGLNLMAVAAVTRLADAPGLGIGPALAGAASCFWRLAGVGVLSALAVAVGLVCLVAPGVYLAVALSLVTPAVVLGGAGVRAAMRTSYRLATHGTFGRAAEVLLLAAMATTLIAAGLGVTPNVVGVLQAARGPAGLAAPLWWRVALAYAGQAVTLPFGTIVAVVLYRDLETRKAGAEGGGSPPANALP